ncbi:MAG: toll/interleukin-1 receptor domain-containing protein [Planctomycetes bacterium]|nr:toll/interleukin-1 receptor domain-containing protein [Planctomycetota bacterium]MCH9726104.1 toll/interleukin-1 receptor domain-containing protein [Planctomycetota bacterium]MCH9777256.1 toll/interleukin-1 receptor domain-containing protein [Planctomycetota bacterium]MCH9791313.1 toll/interleukin-1 receptor domain-containing protein [Planctomycetota bacterium]MDF1743144.1 toll/interleukin-1 receptor domain-containing protein [Gimesia sp.]
MANSEYVEIFRQGAIAIDRWRTENSTENTDIKLDLSGADLSGADLTETNLNGADLRGANLAGADLSGADLVGANLSGADLSRADLCLADLSGADLSGANLHRANLREADLNWAHSHNTLWVELDLSRVVGLNSIVHGGPSTIGVDTLMLSNGKIPQEFLRGCGLPDDVNAYVPTYFANTSIDFFSCYICFSPEDKIFAQRLHDALQARGIRCWLDEKPLLPADGIHVERKIKIWDKILLCASKHSLTSHWVNQEIAKTFSMEAEQLKKDTIVVRSLMPLNLDEHLFDSWAHPDKNTMCERLAADFREWETDESKFEEQVAKLVKVLPSNTTTRT